MIEWNSFHALYPPNPPDASWLDQFLTASTKFIFSKKVKKINTKNTNEQKKEIRSQLYFKTKFLEIMKPQIWVISMRIIRTFRLLRRPQKFDAFVLLKIVLKLECKNAVNICDLRIY